MPDAAVPLALVVAAVAYGALVTRSWRGANDAVGARAVAAFLAALAVLGVALASPLDAAAHRHLAAHMVQHVLLVSVVAPLVVAGRPLARHSCRSVAAKRSAGTSSSPSPLAQVATLLVWHVPVLYDAALPTTPCTASSTSACSPPLSPCGPRSPSSAARPPALGVLALFVVSAAGDGRSAWR